MKYLIFVLLFLTACQVKPHYDKDFSGWVTPDYKNDIILLDPDINNMHEWLKEAKKLFPNPLIVACHGDSEGGFWLCHAHLPDYNRWESVVDVANYYHSKYPSRDIVLLICNGGGVHLHISHVWIPLHDVYQIPHPMWIRWAFPRDGAIYDIKQFVDD